MKRLLRNLEWLREFRANLALVYPPKQMQELVDLNLARLRDPERFERAAEVARTTRLSFWEAWDHTPPRSRPTVPIADKHSP